MKTRLCVTGGLACLAAAMGWAAGCGSRNTPTPTGPTAGVGAPFLRALTVQGTNALTALGQTTQLSAVGVFSDGSKRDITQTVEWSSLNKSVATVMSSGLVTAVDFGRASINAYAPDGGKGNALSVTVLPEGTYILSGLVREAGTLGVTDARIELLGGPISGRAVVTDEFGRYAFNGVNGVEQVRATKTGYVTASQNVSQDTEHVNVDLAPAAPYPELGGAYRLTFTASPSCHLPDDAMSRTYTATVAQTGPQLRVTLANAQFWAPPSPGGPWNKFLGRVSPTGLIFTLYDSYYGGYYGDTGVIEKLADSRYLSLVGTAEATVMGTTISALLAGPVTISTSPPDYPVIAACTASDHQLIFTRTTATTSRNRF